jgi:hypothetical protein
MGYLELDITKADLLPRKLNLDLGFLFTVSQAVKLALISPTGPSPPPKLSPLQYSPLPKAISPLAPACLNPAPKPSRSCP